MRSGLSAVGGRLWAVFCILLLACLIGPAASAAVPEAPYTWKNVAIGGGGFVTGIVIHPKEKDLVYIRTDIGGCYRWDPAGRQWTPLLDFIPYTQDNLYGVDGIALCDADPDVVYIAAGKYVNSDPGDVMKSTDRGRTWTRTNLNKRFGGNGNTRWNGERLAVDPKNADIVFVGTPNDGLWKTADGGKTWAHVDGVPGGTKDLGIRCVLFAGGKIYAGVRGAGVYRSVDDGATWQAIEGAPQDPCRMAMARDGALYVTATTGVFALEGEAWTEISPEKKKAYSGLSVHPTDANILVCAQYYSGFGCPIYYSADKGRTWRKFTSADATQHHSVPWAPRNHFASALSQVAIDPHDPKRLWYTDWYATWVNPDFPDRNDWYTFSKGHEEIVAFSLISPPKGAPLLSGVADVDGFRHVNLDEFPSKHFGGYQDTVSLDFSEDEPQFIVRVGGRRGRAGFSTDGGQTWKDFPKLLSHGYGRIAVSADGARIVWWPPRMSPHVSTDRGETWTKASGAPDNIVSGVWDWRHPLTSDRVNSSRFYLYHEGQVFISTDGGQTFSPGANVARSGWMYSLKAAPGMEGEVWINLDRGGLHRSSDGGQTFTRLADVTAARLFAFGVNPPGKVHPTVFVFGAVKGVDGIFRSDDLGQFWIKINPDHIRVGATPNSMTGDRQIFGRVYIGTNGRGIFYGEPK